MKVNTIVRIFMVWVESVCLQLTQHIRREVKRLIRDSLISATSILLPHRHKDRSRGFKILIVTKTVTAHAGKIHVLKL